MSLFLAEIANQKERERLEKMIDGLVPDKKYLLYPYRYNDEPKPKYIARGKFVGRNKTELIFDRFTVDYHAGYNSIVDAISGTHVIELDGIGIARVVEDGKDGRS